MLHTEVAHIMEMLDTGLVIQVETFYLHPPRNSSWLMVTPTLRFGTPWLELWVPTPHRLEQAIALLVGGPDFIQTLLAKKQCLMIHGLKRNRP